MGDVAIRTIIQLLQMIEEYDFWRGSYRVAVVFVFAGLQGRPLPAIVLYMGWNCISHTNIDTDTEPI